MAMALLSSGDHSPPAAAVSNSASLVSAARLAASCSRANIASMAAISNSVPQYSQLTVSRPGWKESGAPHFGHL